MAVPHYEQCFGILKLLELHKYYPKQITREMALTVPGEGIQRKDLGHSRKLPWFMLQNIIAGNYEGMSFATNTQTSVSERRGPDTLLSDFLRGRKPIDNEGQVNPLDVLTSLFICCDDFVRQILVEKLANCQLGIPLLLSVIDATPQTSNVEMLSWATSTIRKQWQTASGQPVEHSMAVHPLPIVSAFRIGRPRLSKSKIINETINAKQDHFFHSKCEGGRVQKVISNGIVELVWYLPTGRNEDSFLSAFGVMNLRGNVNKYSLQRTFMTKASSTAVIFCQSDMSNKEEIDVISSWNNQSHLILVFDGQPHDEWSQALQHVFDAQKEGGKMIHIIPDLTDVPLKYVLNRCLSDGFPDQITPKSLENCEAIAIDINIPIDDRYEGDNYECKLKAKDLLEKLEQENNKDKHLPLQTISRVIAVKTRELFNMKRRGDMRTELYIEKVTSEITTLRENQYTLWKDQSQMIMVKQFLKSVAFTSLGRSYFYNWTCTMLNRHSTSSLQHLRKQRKLAYEKKEGSENLKQFRKQIFNASVGLENLCREIAQIYEMASELSRMESDIQNFPEIAADMLIDGQPLEIMDGDATYVPTTWLKAVFDFLKAKIGNKKLFVLSIVGVQGSGKSTMLNTMFGFKFPVDAGRCTKGAFAQLVPLDEDLRDKHKCDYIMVVDTEGLCAPELAAIDRNTRDRELATFIIGLADCTIINFMAGDQSSIQEILQIAVYALMKMKLPNLNPSCIFVHQYKSDLLASNKMSTQEIRRKDILDKATKIAAETLGKHDKSFAEVIDFQPENEVYISRLWLGISPMTTPNPEYVRDVLRLRKLVFSHMKEGQSKGIGELSIKLTDVWKAVLYEHFSFSFIHAVELKAHNALEIEYTQASRDFRQTCMSNRHACINACKAIPAEDIEKEGKKVLDEYIHKIQQSNTTFQNRMKEYFKTNRQNATWESQTTEKVKLLRIEMRSTLRDEYYLVKRTILWKSKIDKDKAKYLQEIQKKSQELANELRESGRSVLELETQFNRSWQKWIQDIPEMTEVMNIEETLEDVLLNTFVKEQHVIHDLLKNIKDKETVEVDITTDDIKMKIFSSQKSVLEKARCARLKTQDSAISNIQYHRNMGSNCNETLIKDIVDEVRQLLEIPQNKNSVSFTREGVTKHTCCILWKSISEFKALQKAFNKNNDPRILMLSHRETLWQVFQNECTKVGKALTTAFKMSLPLKDAIDKAINLELFESIVGYFMNSSEHKHTFFSKKSSHAKMLIDLAEKDSFELAKVYLLYPAYAMFNWMLEYIFKSLKVKTDNEETVLQNIYNHCVRRKYQEVLEAITNACKKSDGPTCKVNKLWQDIISSVDMAKLTLVMGSQTHIVCDNDEIEMKDFLRELSAQLKIAEDNLTRCNTDDMEEVFKRTIGEVATFFEKDLIGCEETCPFCGAPCDNIAGCTTHRTECHRPQGIAGQNWHWWNWRWKRDKELVIELCTTAVADTSLQFKKNDVDNKWHKYRDYRTVYESWRIPPIVDTNTQLYWKWFMAKYNTELADFHGCKEAQIPDSWKQITWEAAKQDLINLYNLRT